MAAEAIQQPYRKADKFVEDSVMDRLEQLGIVLPGASNPAATYTNFVVVNGLMCLWEGTCGKSEGKTGQGVQHR